MELAGQHIIVQSCHLWIKDAERVTQITHMEFVQGHEPYKTVIRANPQQRHLLWREGEDQRKLKRYLQDIAAGFDKRYITGNVLDRNQVQLSIDNKKISDLRMCSWQRGLHSKNGLHLLVQYMILLKKVNYS